MNQTLNSTSPEGLTARIKRLPPRKRLIKMVGRATFWAMTRISGLLRPWSVNLLGNTFGSLFYVLSKRYRGVALKNLCLVMSGEMDEKQMKSVARQVFIHFARGAFEFFRFLSLDKKQIAEMVDVDGVEILDAALAEGRGCIVITAHYGNWELLARKMVIMGYKVNVIARDSDDPGMTGIATRIRENGGYRVFDRDQPIIGAFRCLKKNEVLGILPDQNESDGLLVEFFGKLAATAIGPAVLALRSGAPIVPVFAPQVSDGKYVAKVYPRLEFTPSGDEDKDILDLMTLINKAIETEIRRYPSQWLWLHDRWKCTPKESYDGS